MGVAAFDGIRNLFFLPVDDAGATLRTPPCVNGAYSVGLGDP
jgi:hypothetical protein